MLKKNYSFIALPLRDPPNIWSSAIKLSKTKPFNALPYPFSSFAKTDPIPSTNFYKPFYF